MTDDDGAVGIEPMLWSEFAQVIDGLPHIEIRPGPAAAWLADPAILDVPGRNPGRLERVGHRGQVAQRRIGSLEATTMNQDSHGVRSRARRQAQLPVLARVTSVREAVVRLLAWQLLEFAGRHQLRRTRGIIGLWLTLPCGAATRGEYQQ
jgi:hypothetical protein